MSERNDTPSNPELEQWAGKYLPPWVEVEGAEATGQAREAGYYLSPRLRANPSAALDTLTEVTGFVEQWPRSRLNAAQQAYEQATETGGTLPRQTLRAVAAVPAAYNEHASILTQTIIQYARQDMRPGTWVVYALANRADGQTQAAPLPATRTLERAMYNSSAPLWVAERVYNAPTPMGHIQADTFDPVLYHIAQNGLRQRVLGFSHNSDIVHLSTGYIRRICEVAEADPSKEFVTCKMEWEEPGGPDTSMSRTIRYFSAMDDLLRENTSRASVTEANMGVDLGLYAAIGGFLRTAETEQIAQLRQAAARARSSNDQDSADPAVRRQILAPRTAFVEDVSLRTSSRRLQLAFSEGFGPHQAWDPNAVPFSTVNDRVDRSRAPTDTASFPTTLDPPTQAQVLEGIDAFYGGYIVPFVGEGRFTAERDAARRDIGLPPASQISARPPRLLQ